MACCLSLLRFHWNDTCINKLPSKHASQPYCFISVVKSSIDSFRATFLFTDHWTGGRDSMNSSQFVWDADESSMIPTLQWGQFAPQQSCV